jgi:hypothetical protein
MEQVLLPHISTLLQGEEWKEWDDTMKDLQWNPEDVSGFLEAAAAWTANRPVPRNLNRSVD